MKDPKININSADEIEIIDDEDFIEEPNEWYFDDDPYGIVYYEYPDYDDED